MFKRKTLSPLYFLVGLSFLFLFNACKVEDYTCSGYFETQMKSEDQSVRREFRCNEIIFDPWEIDSVNQLFRQYLQDKGFAKIDSCNCTKGLELWSYSGSGDIDINGVIKTPPKKDDNGVGHLFPNLVIRFPLPDQREKEVIEEIKRKELGESPCGPTQTVKIAIVDTGVDSTDAAAGANRLIEHDWKPAAPQVNCPPVPVSPYLGVNTNQIKDLPTDYHGHGTHVQGIVTGISSPDGARSGVSFEFVNGKFTRGNTASGDSFHALCAMYYAIEDGARLINCSWGHLGAQINRDSQLMKSVLEFAQKRDVLVVASTGNDTMNIGGGIDFWPASYAEDFDNVISVGAINVPGSAGVITNFSNHASNKEMSITAWGLQVPSAFPVYVQGQLGRPQTGYESMTGTSMSAPFVTLTAGVIRGLRPGLTAAEVKAIIIQSAIDKGTYKILDHKTAIEEACQR